MENHKNQYKYRNISNSQEKVHFFPNTKINKSDKILKFNNNNNFLLLILLIILILMLLKIKLTCQN